MLALTYVKRNMSRKGWIWFCLSELFYIAEVIISFYIPLAQKALIDAATQDSAGMASEKAIVCFLLAIAIGVVFSISIGCNVQAHSIASSDLRMRTFERILGQKHSDVQKEGRGKYTTLFLDEILPQTLCSTYSTAVISVVQFISILLIVKQWSLRLVFAILGVFVVYLLIIILASRAKKTASGKSLKERMTETTMAQEDIDTTATLSRFGRKEIVLAQMQDKMKKRIRYEKRVKASNGITNSLQEIMPSIVMVVLVMASLDGIRGGTMTMGALVAVIAYIPQILLPSRAVGDIFMVEAWASYTKNQMLDLQKHYEDNIPDSFSLPSPDAKEVLSLRNVGFSYSEGKVGDRNEQMTGKADTKAPAETSPESPKRKATSDGTSGQGGPRADDSGEINMSGISFYCAEGSATALLGLSGEGKSTLIKLMTGEGKPASGEVCLLGTSLQKIPVPLQYTFINVYSQETEIFDDDLRSNILVGRKQIPASEIDATKAALKSAFETCLTTLRLRTGRGSDEAAKKHLLWKELGKEYCQGLRKILGLPLLSRLDGDRESTLVGGLLNDYCDEPLASVLAEAEYGRSYCVAENVERLIEDTGLAYLGERKLGLRGANISGGERQRIALARCLAKENWKILILDEPFTSLDALAEDELSDVLKRSTKGKTLFLVTHKLNLVPLLTDKIVLLENGTIAAYGSHAELRRGNMLYASLWKAFSAQREM